MRAEPTINGGQAVAEPLVEVVIGPYRRLARVIVLTAIRDLESRERRAGAARFLREDLWGTVWSGWLVGEVKKDVVTALVKRRLRSTVKIRRPYRRKAA